MTQRIYVGPRVATTQFSLLTGAIFKGDLPETIQTLANEHVCFSALFVPPEQVAKARRDITDGGNFLSSYYQQSQILISLLNKGSV
ncbi:hypothetical protein [Providencia huashanensis]|uniref:hypothetical protein n=1 Tax=Providencia huashanensis TaxID=3037798 RepID=UPI002AFF0028|nr:hypothetical protein [Providencia sp. 23021821]